MKQKLTRALLTCTALSVAACGEPLAETPAPVIESKEVGQLAQFLRKADPVRDEYIVVLREDVKGVARASPALLAREMVAARNGTLLHTYEHTIKGFATRMSEERMRELLADPRVEFIEQNGYKRISATQSGATWGLDRIDQTSLPLNSSYTYNADGTGVHAYIVDTGMRVTHSQFSGRVGNGFDAITSGGNANDCQGHGTHVAGTVGGTTHGVAKKVKIGRAHV